MSILTGLSTLSQGGVHNPSSNPLDLMITSYKSALPLGPCGGEFSTDIMSESMNTLTYLYYS